jgi:hypothetical protein
MNNRMTKEELDATRGRLEALNQKDFTAFCGEDAPRLLAELDALQVERDAALRAVNALQVVAGMGASLDDLRAWRAAHISVVNQADDLAEKEKSNG